MRFSSLGLPLEPGFDLKDVWLKYRVRYHRPKTLRGLLVGRALVSRRQGMGPDDRPATGKDDAFWALRGISISAGPGEIVGIIGSNGAGKSTLLQVMARIMKPDRGTAVVRGSIGTLLSFGAGFNNDLTGRENVFMNGAILGLTGAQIRERMDDIVELSGIGDFIDAQVGTYSSGMRARLGFAVAVHINPDVLLIDEVVQVGDASFQKRAGTVLDQFRDQRKVIALVSHASSIVTRYCTRVIWMEQGQIRREGSPEPVMAEYLEWSEALARAAPAPKPPVGV